MPKQPSPVEVRWEISRHADFKTLLSGGALTAEAEHDYCVHVDVDGLQPGSHYFYRFSALGETSHSAQTKTLPTSGAKHLRFAQVSCVKYNAGFLNAYEAHPQSDPV